MNVLTSTRTLAKNPAVRTLLNQAQVRYLGAWGFASDRADVLLGWGYKPTAERARQLASERGIPYWALEEGFVAWQGHPSASQPHDRLAYVLDKTGIYYDAHRLCDLDFNIMSLKSGERPFDEGRVDRLRQQLCRLGLSKYNQVRVEPPAWLADLIASEQTSFDVLIDQTKGDASVAYSGGSDQSFVRMLDWGMKRLADDVHHHLVLKVHPDVLLGRKQGYLHSLYDQVKGAPFGDRIHLLSDDVLPKFLLEHCDQLATVSSQMGFEGLWHGKTVHCFAFPFYAGRGLTEDHVPWSFDYERPACSLLQLMQAALIDYSTYFHPGKQSICEVEDILNFLQASLAARDLEADTLYVPNVSLWKRSFIPEFISASARRIRFKERPNLEEGGNGLVRPMPHDVQLIWGMKDAATAVISEEVDSRLRGNDEVTGNDAVAGNEEVTGKDVQFSWGMKGAATAVISEEVDSRLRENDELAGSEEVTGNEELEGNHGGASCEVVTDHPDVNQLDEGVVPPASFLRRQESIKIWRMEDGFIRSVGLGADLRRPVSLVLDDLGIYYNGKQPSRLEVLLNEYELNDYEVQRARRLRESIVSENLTKYNVECHANTHGIKNKANGKKIILVAAQFQQDLSMTFGANKICDNLALLNAVRQDNQDAYIVFKEHPDVYSGVRPGKLCEQTVLELADEYLTNTSLTGLFDVVDEIATICSLTGFEALLRGKKVTTYGLPFYAGWGLTDDHETFPRRKKRRSLDELLYITLVLYSRYVNWETRTLVSPEHALEQIKQDRVHALVLKSSWLSRQWRKMRYLLEAFSVQRLITR